MGSSTFTSCLIPPLSLDRTSSLKFALGLDVVIAYNLENILCVRMPFSMFEKPLVNLHKQHRNVHAEWLQGVGEWIFEKKGGGLVLQHVLHKM